MNRFEGMSSKDMITKLKDECTPRSSIEFDRSKRCKAKASKRVLDDWGDPCEGHQCTLTEGHDKNHMASDGANGWVYFSDSETLNVVKVNGHTINIPMVDVQTDKSWFKKFLGL